VLDETLHILYEHGPCLAIWKPPGLATQAPPGIPSLEQRLKAMLAARPLAPEAVYLGLPHRLDRPVSGAIVFGLNRRATQRLALQFERRTVRKQYWACVSGIVEPAAGTWTDVLCKIPSVPRAQLVPPDHPLARPAVLHYRTLGRTEFGAWLEIELETGRYHQIRAQAAARGHPILGDVLYGSEVPLGPQETDERQRPIALHARLLEFLHPTVRERITVVADVPSYWPVKVGG